MEIIYGSLAATALISLLLICWPHPGDLHPVFLPRRWVGAAYLLFFVFQPINHLAYNYVSLDQLDPVSFRRMCLACTLGIAAWWFGWNWSIGSGEVSTSSRAEISRTGMSVLLIPAGLSIGILLSRIGISGVLQGSLDDVIAVPQEWLSIFGWVLGALLAVGLSALVWGRAEQRRSYQILGGLALLVFFLVSLRMGTRFRTLLLIASVAAPLTNKLSRRRMIVAMAAIGVFFVAYSYIHRSIRTNFTIGRAAEAIEESFHIGSDDTDDEYDWYAFFVFGGDLDAFENGMQLVRAVPEYHDYLYGSTLASVLYNPVPRILWPGKPSPSPIDVLVKTGFGLGSIFEPNIAVSLIGELYANLGWLGVLLGMLLFGWTAKRIHSHLSMLGTQYALTQLGLFCGFIPLIFRGNFLPMMIYYLSPALWLILARVVSKAAARQPEG
jgi:hypothetical protein